MKNCSSASIVTPKTEMLSKLKTIFREKENIVAATVLIATIVIYHILLFVVQAFSEKEGIFGWIGVNFWQILLIPGILSTILYYIFSKKIKKSIFIGVITTVVWILWLILFTYTMVTII